MNKSLKRGKPPSLSGVFSAISASPIPCVRGIEHCLGQLLAFSFAPPRCLPSLGSPCPFSLGALVAGLRVGVKVEIVEFLRGRWRSEQRQGGKRCDTDKQRFQKSTTVVRVLGHGENSLNLVCSMICSLYRFFASTSGRQAIKIELCTEETGCRRRAPAELPSTRLKESHAHHDH